MSAQTSYTVWQLARMAGCADPDAHDSPGAEYLRIVADAVSEDIVYAGEWAEDRAAEIVDGCVPVYTHELWRTFVDLGAYSEDVGDVLEYGGDMARCAAWALYLIGMRLAVAIGEAHAAA